jgi:hypothetical protein
MTRRHDRKIVTFRCNDTTNDAVLLLLHDLLLLALCCRQAACSEMFSEEESTCVTVLDGEKKITEKETGTSQLLQWKEELDHFTLYKGTCGRFYQVSSVFQNARICFWICYVWQKKTWKRKCYISWCHFTQRKIRSFLEVKITLKLYLLLLVVVVVVVVVVVYIWKQC